MANFDHVDLEAMFETKGGFKKVWGSEVYRSRGEFVKQEMKAASIPAYPLAFLCNLNQSKYLQQTGVSEEGIPEFRFNHFLEYEARWSC